MSNWPEWTSPDGSIRLINADCMEVLPTLSGIDCTVTSPPYNQKLDTFRASGFKAEGNAEWAARISSSYFDSMDEPEYQRWQQDVLAAILESSSDGSSLFYNHKCRWRNREMLHPLDIVRGTKWSIRQEIIWSRDGSLTQNAKMFPPSEERIIWAFRNTWNWNPDSNRYMSVWKINSEHYTEHPVAYPVEIPIRCIEATTRAGALVFDPFMGSATTGVAAIRLGRRFVGTEKDPRHFATSVKRIQAELNRAPLFDLPIPTQTSLLKH